MGDLEKWRPGDLATGRRQDGHHLREGIAMEGGDHLREGDPETWRLGDVETWRGRAAGGKLTIDH